MVEATGPARGWLQSPGPVHTHEGTALSLPQTMGAAHGPVEARAPGTTAWACQPPRLGKGPIRSYHQVSECTALGPGQGTCWKVWAGPVGSLESTLGVPSCLVKAGRQVRDAHGLTLKSRYGV